MFPPVMVEETSVFAQVLLKFPAVHPIPFLFNRYGYSLQRYSTSAHKGSRFSGISSSRPRDIHAGLLDSSACRGLPR
jgi:hypothetical protein